MLRPIFENMGANRNRCAAKAFDDEGEVTRIESKRVHPVGQPSAPHATDGAPMIASSVVAVVVIRGVVLTVVVMMIVVAASNVPAHV